MILKPRIARQPLSSWRNDLVEVIGEKEPGEKKFDIKKGIKKIKLSLILN